MSVIAMNSHFILLPELLPLAYFSIVFLDYQLWQSNQLVTSDLASLAHALTASLVICMILVVQAFHVRMRS